MCRNRLRRRSDSAPSVMSVVGSAGEIPIRSTNRERRWRRDDDPLKTLAKTLIFPPFSQAPVRISKFLCAPFRVRLAYPPSKAKVNADGGSVVRGGSSGSYAIVSSRSRRLPPPKPPSLCPHIRSSDPRRAIHATLRLPADNCGCFPVLPPDNAVPGSFAPANP